MADLVGTCPKDFWSEWIGEGDAAGMPYWERSGADFLARLTQKINVGDKAVVSRKLRGWAPVTRVQWDGDSGVICRPW